MRSKKHTFLVLVLSFSGTTALFRIVDCMKRDYLENNCPKICNPDGGHGDAEKG